jgi:hypothetical protein
MKNFYTAGLRVFIIVGALVSVVAVAMALWSSLGDWAIENAQRTTLTEEEQRASEAMKLKWDSDFSKLTPQQLQELRRDGKARDDCIISGKPAASCPN